MRLSVECFCEVAVALTAATLLTSCIAVGPDFQHPAAPDVDRYTPEKLPPRTSSTDAPTGKAQRFVQGRVSCPPIVRTHSESLVGAP